MMRGLLDEQGARLEERLATHVTEQLRPLQAQQAATEAVAMQNKEDLARLVDRMDNLEASLRAEPAPRAAPVSVASSSGSRKNDDEPVAIVYGYPEPRSRALMLEDAKAIIDECVPSDVRGKVRRSARPAGQNYTLTFPDRTSLYSFMDTFRAKEPVHTEEGASEGVHLSVRAGKPLLVRRRGAVNRPVFQAFWDILHPKEQYPDAKIVQDESLEDGVRTKIYYAEVKKRLYKCFSFDYVESGDNISVRNFQHYAESAGNILSEAEFDSIVDKVKSE